MTTPFSVHTEVTSDGWRLMDDGARFSLHNDPEPIQPRVFTTFVAIPREDFAYSIAFLPQHLHRVASSAAATGLITSGNLPSASLWNGAIGESLRKYRSRGTGIALVRAAIGSERAELFLEPYRGGWGEQIDLITVPTTRPAPYWKSTLAGPCVAARRVAQAASADEALLCDSADRVLEGAWSNFFWFDSSGALFTTFRDVLPGIVRQAVLRVTSCRLVDITVAELVETATEAFVTQSTTGITAVRTINSRVLASCNSGTARVRERFDRLAAENLTVFRGSCVS